jgi:hypothetical protein
MGRLASSYYPPRAKWYSPVLNAGNALKRQVWLDRIRLPAEASVRVLVAVLLVPGYAFYARGMRVIGRTIMLGCLFLVVIFLMWLGHPVATVAFGLLLSAHVTSVLFFLSPWLEGARIGFRMVSGLMVLAVLGGCLYTPVQYQIQNHYLMPLRLRERIVIVRTYSSAKAVHRGDWIAYELPSERTAGTHEGGNVVVREGLSLGLVLAVAGDRVRFTSGGFEVNGIRSRLLPHMPTTGGMVVPEKHWFLWPDLVIRGNGNVAEATISTTMLRLATVPETQFIGKPFKRWFWRRQLPA